MKIYSEAETVSLIAVQLIPSLHPELATARIKYIFVDEGSTKAGKPVYGKVKKVSGALEFLLECDFVMEVAQNFWYELSEEARIALIDHLLERCTGEEDEEDGSMVWKIREPDVHEFATILQRRGAWHTDLASFVEIAKTVNIDGLLEEVEEELVNQSQE